MVLHLIGAAVSMAAVILYADRTGWLAIHGSQTLAALGTRAGLAGALVFTAFGFVERAADQAAFEWFHYGVLGCLLLTCAGHAGMRVGRRHSPT